MTGDRIAIIGLGPGGISCAIQLHRYGLRPRIFEPSDTPGLLKNANLVENYPGFPEGITGSELYARFMKQLEQYSPDIVRSRVNKVVREEAQFILDAGEDVGRYKFVVLSTGTRPQELDLDHPREKTFYEVADVPRDLKNILILGGGDAAFDYALNLKDQEKEIWIVCRGERPKCLGLLEKRCQDAGIETIIGTGVTSITEDQGRISATLENGLQIEADCLLCALGRAPKLDPVDKDIRETLDNGGNVEGLFLVGDVKNGLRRQVGIAVGDGLKAAMEIWEMMI